MSSWERALSGTPTSAALRTLEFVEETRKNGSAAYTATLAPWWLAGLPAGERHMILAAERRRRALELLAGRTVPVALGELAAELAAREAAGDAVDEDTVKRVAITLHHAHLSALADAGPLVYDPAAHRIESEG